MSDAASGCNSVQVGLLPIYDMCKTVERGMVMSDIRVLEKQDGKAATGATEAGAERCDKF